MAQTKLGAFISLQIALRKIAKKKIIENIEYDPITHITAKELRDMGFAVPANIPDCGYIPRLAMQLGTGKPKVKNGQSLYIPVELTINAPFKWVETTVIVEKDKL